MTEPGTEKPEVQEGSQVVMEITVRALDDANVSLTFPEKANIWVLRGVLAKALDALNQVTVAREES